MKGSEFINLMRKAIREEVRAVIKEELKAIKPLLAEQQKVTKPLSQPKAVTKPQRTLPLVTMDDGLASLINEGSGFENEEWPDMNGGPMTSDFFAADSEFGMNGFSQQQMQQIQQPTTMIDPLMRNYSSVLKAADQHAQGYRP